VGFLSHKWVKELDYRLIKELWALHENCIAVRFQYEYHDATGQWWRAYGNENWQFDAEGLMSWRQASINDVKILESDRKSHWDLSGPRPSDHPGLSELGM
jgi:nuclear transport factor 2 (NTF2) superfamily protein